MLLFHVSNMSCGGCAKGVTHAVQGIDAGAKVDVDLSTGEISVSGRSDVPTLLEALKRAGYPAESRGLRAA